MGRGTPGFVGDRLREAREAKCVTATSLANLIEVSRQAVSQYERGHQSPTPRVMDRICNELDLPLSFFLDSDERSVPGVAYFRSLSAATKRTRTSAARRVEWLSRIVRVAAEHVVLPVLDLPILDVPQDPRLIDESLVERAAERARDHLGLGPDPIRNMTWEMERRGVVVARFDLGDHRLDGLSQWMPDGRPYVVVNHGKMSAVRLRMDIAHELAHLLLHRSLDDSQHQQHFNLLEQQARRFASAFLLPREAALAEIREVGSRLQLGELIAIKERWRISIGATIVRACQLGIVGEQEKRRLFIGMSRKGWRKWEPLDSVISLEHPRVLVAGVELALRDGALSLRELLEQTRLPQHELETMLGVETGHLSNVALENLGLTLR